MRPTARTIPAIDVHAHYVPEMYRRWLVDSGLIATDGFPLPSWDPGRHVEDMDRTGIGGAVLSLSSPDIHWGDGARARSLARDANDVAAEAIAAHPKRFGFYATLPLPDVEASLAEIEYAFEVLGADGVKLYSNNNGVYLGDPALEPVFAELGRRNAVVTVHPVRAKAVPDNVLPGVPYPLLEFQFDTTRAVANMIFNGTLRRNPGVKFVCPHMGALFPLLGARMEGIAGLMVHFGTAPEEFEMPDVKAVLAGLYYDTAGGFNLPVQLPALKGIGRAERILYGSDYPFTPTAAGAPMLEALRQTDLLDEEEKVGVLHDNAVALFPAVLEGLTREAGEVSRWVGRQARLPPSKLGTGASMMVYLLGLLSPLAFALGTVMQQRGTLETRAREGDPRFLVQMIRKPVWLAGGFITVCAFLLQAAALRYGSLSLVQALQALSLVFALPLGVRLTGQRVGRRSAAGAALTVIGLVVFVVLGQTHGGVSEPGGTDWLVAGIAIVMVTAGLSWAGVGRRGAAAAALLATAAGICFALQAGVTKVLVTRLDDGLVAVAGSWPLYALISSAAIGFALQQASLKTGALAPSMAALEAATLAVSVLIGVTVFGEVISAEAGRLFPIVGGLGLAIVGVVILASGGNQPPGGRAGGQIGAATTDRSRRRRRVG